MRILVGSMMTVLMALAIGADARADDLDIPREHHAWARFPEGSWKRVRVVTQQLDAQGRVVATSITETKTLLSRVAADGFSLQIESTVEVAGRKIVSDPKTVEQQYNGAIAGHTAKVRLVGEDQITIDGKSFDCKIQQYDISGGQSKTVTKTYYTPDTPPYVLRRESVTMDLMSQMTVGRTLVEVTSLGVPVEILGKKHRAAKVHVEQKHLKGREVTDAVSSLEIPGGIVSHESREYDAADKVLSTSKLELLEFHIAPVPEESQSSWIRPRSWQPAGARLLSVRQACRAGWQSDAGRGRVQRRASYCAQ